MQVYSIVALVAKRANEDAALPMNARRMLQAEELWPLDAELVAASATAAVEAAWQGEVAARRTDASVLNAIVWRMHGGSGGVPRLAFLYLGKIIGSLGQPIFFWCILELYFKADYSQGAGYGFVAGLVASAVLASLLEHQGLYHSGRLKVSTTIGLRGLIYQKALRLAEFQVPQQGALSDTSKAAPLGLSQWASVVASDAPAVAEYLNVICPMWLGIFETAVCIALMAVIVNYAVFAGFVSVLLLVVVSNELAKRIGQKAKAIGAAGGQRTQLLGQLLGIIRAVKFYAWEAEFIEALLGKRAVEQAELKAFHQIKTLSFVVAVIAPMFLGVAVMLIYSAYSFITLSVAFPAIVLVRLPLLRLLLLRIPLILVPICTSWEYYETFCGTCRCT
jgi:ABC-type multidrug transport system fused ATPase/permease subunit